MIATWFGPEDTPLFGVWHLPDGGAARTVAVLCSPLGREQLVAHRSFRILAEELAEQGVGVLRFDYFGTADSAGDAESPGLVAAWLESIGAAVATARAAGAAHVTLVGLRMGAVLAGIAAERGVEVDAFVAWDPCASGSAFLREEGVLRRLSLTEVPITAPAGAVEAAGAVYSAETAADLSPLRLPAVLPAPSLVLTRDDRPVPKPIAAAASSPGVTRVDTDEQAAFLDVMDLDSLPPRTAIRTVAEWVAQQAPPRATRLDVRVRESAVVGSVDGEPITERITSLGPNRLFGITSQPSTPVTATVLFTPTATNYHPGVARIAVDLGRRLAASGLASVRYDPYDLGDSPGGSAPEGPHYYTERGVRDAADAARAGRALFGSELAIVGLCSGAWVANSVVQEVRPAAVYLLNPLVWSRTPPVMGPSVAHAFTRRTFNQLHRIPGLVHVAVAGFRSLVTAGLVDGPARMLDGRGHRDTRITVLLGPGESDVLARKAGLGSVARLKRRPHLRFVSTEHEDHSLHTAALRGEVMALVPEWIRADIRPSTVDEGRVESRT